MTKIDYRKQLTGLADYAYKVMKKYNLTPPQTLHYLKKRGLSADAIADILDKAI